MAELVDLRSLDGDQLETLIADLAEKRVRRASRAAAHKRQRDAERHLDVRCPACGAAKRARCLRDGMRTDNSHPERAWKTRACPACGAGAGEWCKVADDPAGSVYTSRIHAARVEGD